MTKEHCIPSDYNLVTINEKKSPKIISNVKLKIDDDYVSHVSLT